MVFDFDRFLTFFLNGSRIHPFTNGKVIFTLLIVISYVFTIIMPFYGFFVTFQNLDV